MKRADQHLADRVYEFLQVMGYRALGDQAPAGLADHVIWDSLKTLNPDLSEQQRREALELFKRRTISLAEREWIHAALLHGIRVDPDDEPAFTAQLLAFDRPEANSFQVARHIPLEDVTVDIGLYVNGVLVSLIDCTEESMPGESIGVSGRLARLGQKGGIGLTSVHLIAALSRSEAVYGGVGAASRTYRAFTAAYPNEAEFRSYHQAAPTLHGEFLYSLFAPANLLAFLHFLTVVDTQGSIAVAGPFQRIGVHQALEYFDQASRGIRPLTEVVYENSIERPSAALVIQPVGTGHSATVAWIAHALQLQSSTRTLGLIVVTDRRVLAEQVHQVLRAQLRLEVLLAFTPQEFQECAPGARGAVIVTAAHSLRNWTEVPGPAQGGWGVIVTQPSPPTSLLLETLDRLFHRPIVLALSASLPTERSESNFNMPWRTPDLTALIDEVSAPIVVAAPEALSAKNALAEVAMLDDPFLRRFSHRTPQELALEARTRIMQVTLDEHRLAAVAENIAEHWQARLNPSGRKGLVIVHSWAVAQQLATLLESILGPEMVTVAGSQFEEDRARQSRRPVGSFGAGISRAQIREFQQDGPPYLWVSTHTPTGIDLSCSAVYLDKKVNRTELLQILGLLARQQPHKTAAYLVDYWGNLAEEASLAHEFLLPILTEEEALAQLERLAGRARQVLSLSPALAQASAKDPTQRNADTQLLQAFTAALDLVGARFAPTAIRQLHEDFKDHIEQLYNPGAPQDAPDQATPPNWPELVIEDMDLFPTEPSAPPVLESDVQENSRLAWDVQVYLQQRGARLELSMLDQGLQQLIADAPYLWWEKPTARRLVRRELRQLLSASLPDPEEVDFHVPPLLDILEKHARMQE